MQHQQEVHQQSYSSRQYLHRSYSYQVGYDTCHSSDDQILQQDMPPALQRVETSSRLLEDACHMLKGDPFSVPARKKLIDGARGILQGTSALLLCFDESEVSESHF
ncbi:hypothetical protein COOONC_06733 [Cooperia oncophora]